MKNVARLLSQLTVPSIVTMKMNPAQVQPLAIATSVPNLDGHGSKAAENVAKSA